MNVVIGSLGISKYYGAFSNVYLVYKKKLKDININYIAYIFSNKNFYKSLIKICTGIMDLRESLNKNEFKKILLPYPPKEEQEKIASFLDEKIEKIDKLIKQKEKLIKLLKERKEIVINDAVIKGLNKQVKMKNSGIEWLGEIPEHWEVTKLKYVVKNKTIKSMESDFKIALENIESKTTKYIKTQEIVFSEAGINFKKNDVLFSKLRPYLAKVYLAERNGLCVSEFLVLESLKNIKSLFLKYLLVSYSFIKNVNSATYGTKMPRASWNFIGNSFIPLPPLNEQKQIVEYIENEVSKIDKAVKLQQNYINKLKEYKTTLIDNVVTGKRRVV